MKYIITENQYKRLTEGENNDFESFLTSKFPNINNLKKRYYNTSFSGPIRKYSDPEKDIPYFRVSFKSPPSWESGVGAVGSHPFVRLFVLPKIYTYLKKHGMNFEYDLMEWFNKTYNENVNSVLKGGLSI